MSKSKQWDIVLTPFPFTDLTGSKVRPAVIISGGMIGDEDVVVLFITSGQKNSQKFDVKINSSKENGLKINSNIKCAKIATLEKKVVLGKLGILEREKQKEVSKKLKDLFGL